MTTEIQHWHQRYKPNHLRAVLASAGIGAAVLTTACAVGIIWSIETRQRALAEERE